MCIRIKYAYGRSQGFSSSHKHLPHCRFEHKLRQLYRSTHNLHLCHMHTHPSHSYHNMGLDPPVGTSIYILKKIGMILVYHIIRNSIYLLRSLCICTLLWQTLNGPLISLMMLHCIFAHVSRLGVSRHGL